MSTNQISLRQLQPGSTSGVYLANSGVVGILKYNLTATTSPAAGNDNTQGYAQGSFWYDTTAKRNYLCENAATGAAVWKSVGTIPFSQVTGITGTADTTTFLRGDGSWNNTITGPITVDNYMVITGTGSASVTAGSMGIWNVSGDMMANIPTGGSFYVRINNTNVFNATGSLTTVYSSGGIYFPSTGTITNTNKQIASVSGALQYNTISSTSHTFTVVGTNVATLNGSDWNVGTNTGTACNISGNSTFKALAIKVPSTGFVGMYVNNSLVSSFESTLVTLSNTNGIYLNSSTGTITSTNRQIAGTSGGLAYNTPTGVVHEFMIAGTGKVRFSGAGLLFPSDHTGWTNTDYGFYRYSGGIVYNVPSTLSHQFAVAGANYLIVNAGGASWTTDQTVSASISSLVRIDSGSMVYNVPTSKLHSFRINNVEIARIDSTGLVVTNDAQDWFAYSQNYYH